ncbi:MAG: PHP domain-containing protein [Clostridia bacterium]|nr:PHP domain-containing protein [Clostridia bacterium]
MKYCVDNDLHIHSKTSSCSNDPEQTNERILQYAKENRLKTICLADHFWDEAVDGASEWYKPQNFEHISKAKPLPQDKEVRFLFGCETELDKNLNLGISKEKFDLFDFIVIPTTHFHMKFTLTDEDKASPENRAKAWVKRLDTVLNMDLPFYKVGIAHLTCGLIAPSREELLNVLTLIPQEEMRRLFKKASSVGVGIEINSGCMNFTDEEADVILKPYRIAKDCGCKFYLGSDAHHPLSLDNAKARLEKGIELLGLTEEDKFII